MRSKTILATALASALAAPLAAQADDDSYSKSPSASASVGGASVQGSLGSSERSAGAYGRDRDDRYAQNDDRDHGKHRGRDGHRDEDKDRQASNRQYGASSSRNDPYAQNQYPGQSRQQSPTNNPY